MEEREINREMFLRTAKKLFSATRKLIAYLQVCCQERSPNKQRVKSELDMIRELADRVEQELDNV